MVPKTNYQLTEDSSDFSFAVDTLLWGCDSEAFLQFETSVICTHLQPSTPGPEYPLDLQLFLWNRVSKGSKSKDERVYCGQSSRTCKSSSGLDIWGGNFRLAVGNKDLEGLTGTGLLPGTPLDPWQHLKRSWFLSWQIQVRQCLVTGRDWLEW